MNSIKHYLLNKHNIHFGMHQDNDIEDVFNCMEEYSNLSNITQEKGELAIHFGRWVTENGFYWYEFDKWEDGNDNVYTTKQLFELFQNQPLSTFEKVMNQFPTILVEDENGNVESIKNTRYENRNHTS